MKELIEILLKNLTDYLPRITRILRSPRKAILRLSGNEEEQLRSAFTFFLLTLSIGIILQAPLLTKDQDLVRIAGSLLIIRVVAVLTFAAVIQWLFSVGGGQGTYQKTLCASLYISSPAYLLLVIAHLIGTGILSSHDPSLAEAWRLGQADIASVLADLQTEAQLASTGFQAFMALQFIVTTAWFIFCWEIYRRIHHASRLKSITVYTVTVTLWCIYWTGISFLMKGLNRGAFLPMGYKKRIMPRTLPSAACKAA